MIGGRHSLSGAAPNRDLERGNVPPGVRRYRYGKPNGQINELRIVGLSTMCPVHTEAQKLAGAEGEVGKDEEEALL